ncbi:MAG: ribosome recycling factor [Bacteroidaceae bacterium]|nr:ribosome recycling factor [Bacteroidaceae bacterium]
MQDLKSYLNETEEMMEMAILHIEDELAHIRAGKADIRLLDGIRVDNYGMKVPINNAASVSTPDARTIAIRPWDKSMLRVIEKAIIDSNLGIMPENNGDMIRISIPPLTEERRKQLVKQCNKEVETAKISVRNARRDCIERLKKAVKEGMPEDEQKDGEEKVQKLHDKYIKKIDEVFAAKEKEIMTI